MKTLYLVGWVRSAKSALSTHVQWCIIVFVVIDESAVFIGARAALWVHCFLKFLYTRAPLCEWFGRFHSSLWTFVHAWFVKPDLYITCLSCCLELLNGFGWWWWSPGLDRQCRSFNYLHQRSPHFFEKVLAVLKTVFIWYWLSIPVQFFSCYCSVNWAFVDGFDNVLRIPIPE